MATGPDVRVRLTAEGEAQVVNALRKVASESQRTGRAAARGFGQFNASLAGARLLLGQLAAAASVGVFVAIAKNAANAADQLGKMAQRVGASVENLSALRLAAQTADVSMEQLQTAFVVFNRRAAELQGGSKDAVAAFKAVGLSARDFKGKDAAERLELIARAFGRLEDSPNKTALAFQLFGRQAAALIPLMNDLSEKGLKGAIDRARELGVLLSADTARAAQALNDDFAILREQVTATAARFVEGLAPAVHVALVGVQKDLGGSGDAVVEFGRSVGKFLGLAILLFQQVADEVQRVLIPLQTLALAVVAFFKGGQLGLVTEFARGQARLEEFLDGLEKRTQERLQRAEDLGRAAAEGAKSLPKLRAGAGTEEAPVIPAEPKAGRQKEFVTGQRPFTQLEALREQQDEVRLAFEEFDSQQRAIADRVAAGLLSQVTGEERLLALEKERLPLLKAQAEALIASARAAQDPGAVAQALQFSQAVTELELHVESATNLVARLGAAAEDTFKQALTDFFTTGIREARSFVDAIRQIGLAVFDAVREILAAEIAAQSVRALRGILGFSGGGAARRAEGGMISGPGTGTSDSVPAWLSSGEFVVRASVVERPGMLQALQAINRGFTVPALADPQRVRRFADGGLVSGVGAARLEGSLTIGLERGLVLRELSTPEGERAVVRVISKNSRASRSALGQE